MVGEQVPFVKLKRTSSPVYLRPVGVRGASLRRRPLPRPPYPLVGRRWTRTRPYGRVDSHRIQGPSWWRTVASCRVTAAEISMPVCHANHSQSADLWGIRPILRDHNTQPVGRALALVFSAVLWDSFVPRDWKTAIVCPVFKGGGKRRTRRWSPPIARFPSPLLWAACSRPPPYPALTASPSWAPLRFFFHVRQGGCRAGFSAEILLAHLISGLVEAARLASHRTVPSGHGVPPPIRPPVTCGGLHRCLLSGRP